MGEKVPGGNAAERTAVSSKGLKSMHFILRATGSHEKL